MDTGTDGSTMNIPELRNAGTLGMKSSTRISAACGQDANKAILWIIGVN